MRLIDADELLEKAKELGEIGCKDFCVDLKDIISAEEIDAVEVVRCKDCVSYGVSTNNGRPLSYDCLGNFPNDFCSRGRKKGRA